MVFSLLDLTCHFSLLDMLPEPDLFSSVGHRTVTAACDALDKSEVLKCNGDHEQSMLTNQRHQGVNSVKGFNGEAERRARKWYLIVIVLLYLGLLTSFCLNISLLMKDYSMPVYNMSKSNKGDIYNLFSFSAPLRSFYKSMCPSVIFVGLFVCKKILKAHLTDTKTSSAGAEISDGPRKGRNIRAGPNDFTFVFTLLQRNSLQKSVR